MQNKKSTTEFSLSFCSHGVLIVHPKDIENIKKEKNDIIDIANNSHIYLIARRPRITFSPNSVHIIDGNIVGKFEYSNGENKKESWFLHRNVNTSCQIVIGKYPHTEIHYTKNDKVYSTVPANLMSIGCNYVDDLSIRDLEILYVGMSYAKGKRSAQDRLSSHSTLQKILADINFESPEMETLIIMVEFLQPKTAFVFYPGEEDVVDQDNQSVLSVLKKQNDKITKELEIMLIEASLIKYFSPKYNNKYKNKFPTRNQKILTELYAMNFGGLSVNLNTKDVNVRLYSGNREAGYHHMILYDLFDLNERDSFFRLMHVNKASDKSNPIF